MTKPKSNTKASISVNKTTLEQLTQTLCCLLGQSKDDTKDNEKEDVDPTDLTAILNLFIQSVTVLTNHIKLLDQNNGTGGESKEVSEKVRVQDDEIDECRQRSLHGNLIVTSQAFPQKNKVSLLKSDH